MRISRRHLLELGASGLATLAWPKWARSQTVGTDSVLVVVFQRGAADGLNLVIPHADPDYYALRPNIGVTPGTEIDLDGFFGFHPALAPLLPVYQGGELTIVHAAGSQSGSRSHFSAQDFMERAAPEDPLVTTGWLNRYLATLGSSAPDYAGLSIGTGTSVSLQGPLPVVTFKSLSKFSVTGARSVKRSEALRTIFSSRHAGSLRQAAENAFVASELFAQVSPQPTVPYPTSGFGTTMMEIAGLIKADIGIRVISVSLGGWDHHTDEVTRISTVAGDFASTLAAFQSDLGVDAGRTLTLAMTEFGRTAAENGSAGTDHGHGSVMFAMGGAVNGGRVVTAGGQWPGLAPENLFEGRDLAVTTDFRDLFAEVLDRHMNVGDPTSLFPGYQPTVANYPGILL